MFGQSANALLTALLASLVIASQVDAGGLKSLFGRDKSYEQFANDLYKLTQSSELAVVADATSDLLSRSLNEKRSKSYGDLVFTLDVQTSTKNDNLLCGSTKSLRYLAKAMAANGNLDGKKLTEPIKHLNRIIIRQVARARSVCFDYLASRWPAAWYIPIEWPNAYEDLNKLDILPYPLLLDSELSPWAKEIEEKKQLRWSCVLVRGSNEKLLLSSYADLLMASHIVEPESGKMAKFYQDARERPVLGPIEHPNKQLLVNAYRYRACELLAARDAKN